MGITFDHVEGVVQKATEGGSQPPAPAGDAGGKAAKSPHEQFEEQRRRAERLAERLHAD
jgi:hypothetical protein